MGIDNKDELDDELVKSLERLVEEETSVAKAFVDNQKESSAENTAAKDSQDTDIEMGKTKVIPKVTTDMLTKSDDDVQKTGVYNVDEVRDNIRISQLRIQILVLIWMLIQMLVLILIQIQMLIQISMLIQINMWLVELPVMIKRRKS